MKKLEFKPTGKGNYVVNGPDFYISYNPSTQDHYGFTELGNILGGNLKDGEETALLDRKTNTWMILEGDFREEYIKVFSKGLKECKKIYKKNIDKRSNWSTD